LKRVVLLRRARDEIEAIYDFTAGRWGIAKAVSYNRMIRERIEGLASGLTASRRAEEVGPGLRRALMGSHVVFFREDAAAVTVVRVLHQSMDVGA
jgi:toxin ParE1/3/4